MTIVLHHIAARVAMMRSIVSPDYTEFALIPWEAFMSSKAVTYTDNECLRHQWEHDNKDGYGWYFYFRLPPDALPYTMIRVLGQYVFSQPPSAPITTNVVPPFKLSPIAARTIITAIQQGQAGPPFGSTPNVKDWPWTP